MYKLSLFSFASLLSSVVSHVEMVEPAPRNSKNLKGVRSGLIDYGMNSPLGQGRPYPCIGYEKGPASKSYSPGDSIETELFGSATHNGGHCQFSLSYDGKTFVALKTVLGDCLIASKSYSIPIPKDAPSGDAVYAWSWINRTGNREFYMNCADIKILGNNKSGSVKGHEIVVAHVDAGGKKTSEFPEGFSDDFGKQIFESTPMVSISPSGSKQESSDNAKPEQSSETNSSVNGIKPSANNSTPGTSFGESGIEPSNQASQAISSGSQASNLGDASFTPINGTPDQTKPSPIADPTPSGSNPTYDDGLYHPNNVNSIKSSS